MAVQVGVVLGVGCFRLVTAHKVVDYVEVIVDHVPTSHNILTLEEKCCA